MPITVNNFIGLAQRISMMVSNIVLFQTLWFRLYQTPKTITGDMDLDQVKPSKMRSMKKHRGIVSMANRGANTNDSQFFMTGESAHHILTSHTIFLRLREWMLWTIEALPNPYDHPTQDAPLKILFWRSCIKYREKKNFYLCAKILLIISFLLFLLALYLFIKLFRHFYSIYTAVILLQYCPWFTGINTFLKHKGIASLITCTIIVVIVIPH